jgi:lysophosphatidic acid acyltransferase/lysophosphatidylinositol acyltransferase
MDKDKQTLEESHAALQSYPVPFWMYIYCEGTRFTKTKHVSSMEVARSKGLPELKHHLLPRTRGFNMALQGFKDKIGAIYDVELCVPSGSTAPTLKNIMCGRSCYGEILIRRIPVSSLPVESEEASVQWLHQLYQQKDKNFEVSAPVRQTMLGNDIID